MHAFATPLVEARPPSLVMRAPVLQRRCACGGEIVAGGECAQCRAKRMAAARGVPIAPAGDAHEREADRLATQVTQLPAPRVQRKPAAGPSVGGAPSPGGASSGGQPLPAAARARFEPSFGRDFSHVRVHTDTDAAQRSRALGAEAFTIGQDIYFGAGRFKPGTSAGDELIAHELVHTVQQRDAAGPRLQRRVVCDEEGVCRTEEGEDPQMTPAEEEPNMTPAAGPEPNMTAAAGGGGFFPGANTGSCTPAEHRMLQNEVDRACDRPLRCSPQADSCADLMRKIDERAECIRARTRINARCFAGGDVHHIAMIAQAVAGLANCWTIYNAKCQPTAPPVPVPETERQPAERRVVDQGFMEKMAAITGLSGAALIAYLIISEGSRAFPPRNLIPVP